MESERKKELHKKYLLRQLSQTELREYFDLLKDIRPDDLEDAEKVAQLYPVQWQPEGKGVKARVRRDSKARRFRLSALRGMAAMLFLALTAGGIFYFHHYNELRRTQTFKYVRVDIGRMIHLKLEDGTDVTLESGSVLKYPEKFAKEERRVYLMEGRAFFNVARQSLSPFTVETSKLRTTVLGTSFVIQHYHQSGYEKVSLYSGKVKIDRQDNTGQSVIMRPGQEYEFDNREVKTGILSSFSTADDPVNGGRIQFSDTKFSEAMYRIASYYGIKVHFNEKEFEKDVVSGSTNVNSAEELLNSLAFINHFKIIKINHLEYRIMKEKKTR